MVLTEDPLITFVTMFGGPGQVNTTWTDKSVTPVIVNAAPDAFFTSATVVVDLESRTPKRAVIGVDMNPIIFDVITVTCWSQKLEEVWHMSKEVRRLISANMTAPPGGIEEIEWGLRGFLKKAMTVADRKAVYGEVVRVRLNYQE